MVDCTDNAETRYLVNELCQTHGVPWCLPGRSEQTGRSPVLFRSFQNCPCLRCIFPQTELDYDQAPSCSTAGVLGSTTLVMGALQTAEVIKLLTGTGTPLIGRLVLYDGLSAQFTEIEVAADPDCLSVAKADNQIRVQLVRRPSRPPPGQAVYARPERSGY